MICFRIRISEIFMSVFFIYKTSFILEGKKYSIATIEKRHQIHMSIALLQTIYNETVHFCHFTCDFEYYLK